MSYVWLYVKIIAPSQWYHLTSSEIFRKLTTISLAMREKDLISGRLDVSGKAIVKFQNVYTQIVNNSQGFWFKRIGHTVNDILVRIYKFSKLLLNEKENLIIINKN